MVLAPPNGDTFVLLRILPHDKAIAWAMKQESSINAVTRAVEIRDAATLDEITPAYERVAESSPKPRLFAKFSDGDLSALGIDPETLRQARSLVDQEQLDVFAPLLPQDRREVLQYLAAGCTVEEVWRDIVAPALQDSTQPVDARDYETAIRHTRARIALVTATERQAARGQPVDLGTLSKSFPGVDDHGGIFRAHLELATPAIALKRRVVVLQAVEHAQSDPGNLSENFTRALKRDQQRLDELESSIAGVLVRLSTLELARPSGLRPVFTTAEVDRLMRAAHRIRRLGDGVAVDNHTTDVAIEIARDEDGSVVVFPALPTSA